MTSNPVRRSLEISGVTHGGAPIPMAARVRNMIFSSGVMGKDPATDKLPAQVDTQARFMFQHMKTLIELGGGTLEDVGHVTIFIKDNTVRAAINKEWIDCFSDPHSRPARHILVHNLPEGMFMQLEFVAVL